MRFALLLFVLRVSAAGQVPRISTGGVVNAASFGSPVAPGGIASIFGTSLASGTLSASPPFPSSLGGTSVTMNGITAPVLFVSPGQVNVQVPAAVGGGSLINANGAWLSLVFRLL